MFSYLWKRNSTYYYRIKIPSDLSPLFPAQLIRISLRTNDTDAAKVSAANVHRKVQNNFALLRSGAVDAALAGELIKALMPGVKQFKVVKAEEGTNIGRPTLSQMIQEYIADRSPRWTEKTKLEFRCQYGVLLRILGDRPVADYTRTDLISCRDTLLKLPKNFTKSKELNSKSIIELTAQEWPETIKPKTVNTYVCLLSLEIKGPDGIHDLYITESGVYKLIMAGDSPAAMNARKILCEEVLPKAFK